MKYLFNKWAAAGLLSLLGASAAQADPDKLATSTRYDTEYPVVAYSQAATANRVYRLNQRLASGELKLEWEPGTGYLRSLLKALEIDVDSQVLVFSRTSLQIEHISPQTPRAVYFNDDTYVGYVQNSPLIELTAIDADKGAVFYGFENRVDLPPEISREGGRCLTCHDTFSMGGGGVPRVMVLSSPVDDAADPRTITAGEDVDDSTAFPMRWGGWYVTGNTGKVVHLGNLPLREGRGNEKLRQLSQSRLGLLELNNYFDTGKYLSARSDVVALTVLEHQTRLQNLMTRVNYKIRTVLERDPGEATPSGPGAVRSWEDISPRDHQRLHQMMEPLVRAMFLSDAVPLDDRMTGSSGFAERFAKLGPRDSRGRSLRDLDLQTRVFRHPLSFTIYSPQFDALPQFAREYIHKRIAEVVKGTDTTGLSAALSPQQRQVLREILVETKPALAALLRE